MASSHLQTDRCRAIPVVPRGRAWAALGMLCVLVGTLPVAAQSSLSPWSVRGDYEAHPLPQSMQLFEDVTGQYHFQRYFLELPKRDEGIGISERDQTRVFEKFVQAVGGGTRRFGRSGLGLAITKDFVELHRGKIWVQSEAGKGSTFFVRLPSVARFAELSRQAEPKGEGEVVAA